MNPSSTTSPPSGGTHPLGASLRRSTGDRILLGLCGGIARSTGTSAIAVRLGTLALGVLLLPIVVLAYLVTALILPRDDGSVLLGPGSRERRDSIVAVVFTIVAVPIVLGAGAGSLITAGDAVWPAIVVAALVALGIGIWRPGQSAVSPEASAAGAPAPAPVPTAATAPDGPGTHPADLTVPAATHGDLTTQTVAATSGDDTAQTVAVPSAPSFVKPGTALPADAPTMVRSPAQAPVPPAAGPMPRRRGLALPVIAVLALIPSIFAVLVSTGILDSTWSLWAVMLALMAVAAAGGAVLIAVLRPSYLGAALLVLVAATLGASSVGVHQFGPVLDDGVGERIFRPTAVGDLGRTFTLGAGELTVDLRDLDLRRGSRTTVNTKIGFGQLLVIVPRGVRVTAAPGSAVTGVTTSARRNGASASQSASAPVIELGVRARGAEVQLLTGSARRTENLETLALETTGFWDGSSVSSSATGVAAPPAPPRP